MVDVMQAVYSLLSGDPALAGATIRPGRAGQKDPYPTLSFRVVSHVRGHVLGGSNGIAEDRLQFDVCSLVASEVVALARALEDLLDAYHGTVDGLEILWVAQESEADLDEPAESGTDRYVYRKSIDYRFKYRTHRE